MKKTLPLIQETNIFLELGHLVIMQENYNGESECIYIPREYLEIFTDHFLEQKNLLISVGK